MNVCFDVMFNRVLNQLKAYHNWSVGCAIWVFPAREHFPADVLLWVQSYTLPAGCTRLRKPVSYNTSLIILTIHLNYNKLPRYTY
jgi:hypothetical protein